MDNRLIYDCLQSIVTELKNINKQLAEMKDNNLNSMDNKLYAIGKICTELSDKIAENSNENQQKPDDPDLVSYTK